MIEWQPTPTLTTPFLQKPLNTTPSCFELRLPCDQCHWKDRCKHFRGEK